MYISLFVYNYSHIDMTIFTTGPIADEERQLYVTNQPGTYAPLYAPPSPGGPYSPTSTTLSSPASPGKKQQQKQDLHDYLEGRRPYRRTQTCGHTVKRWLIGPPVLIVCIFVVVGLAWLVFTRVYGEETVIGKRLGQLLLGH